MSQPVIIKNKIVYGYMDKTTVCRDMGREDYNNLTEAQQLNGDVCFIQGVDASAFAPTNSLWNKVGTTPLDSELPSDCSNAINQLKSNLTVNTVSITPASNFTVQPENSVYRIGRLIICNINIGNVTVSQGQSVTLGTIDARPMNNEAKLSAIRRDNADSMLVTINGAGSITAYAKGGSLTQKIVNAYGVFVEKD